MFPRSVQNYFVNKILLVVICLISSTFQTSPTLNSGIKKVLDLFNECTFHLVGDFKNGIEHEYLISYSIELHPTVIDNLDAKDPGTYGYTIPVPDQLYNSTVFARFHARFTGCVLQFLFCDWINYQFMFIDRFLKGLVVHKTNPDFIIFTTRLFNPLQFNQVISPNFYTLTSKFMILSANIEIYMMCTHCNTIRIGFELVPLVNKLNLSSIDSLHKIWYRIHSNLQMTLVQPFVYYQRNSKKICNLYYNGLDTSESNCVVVELGQKFNYSTYPKYRNERLVGIMSHGAPAGRLFNYPTFVQAGEYKNIWINYACDYRPYILIVFTSRSNFNFLTLLQPMDQYLWIGLAISFVFVALILHVIIKTKPNSNVREPVYWTISVIFEQSDEKDSRKYIETYGWGLWFLTIAWLLTSFSLGNGYKGALFSCLTAMLPPKVPGSIPELVNSSMMFVTTTSHSYQGQRYSTFKDIVLADMMYDETGMSQFHFKLRHWCRFLRGIEYQIVNNITKSLPVNSDGPHKVDVEKEFALISARKDADSFAMIISKFSDYLAIRNNEVSPYITRIPWFGYRNFFSELFIQGLASLYESGIYDRWKKHSGFSGLISQLNQADKMLNSTTKFNYYSMLMLLNAKSFKQEEIEKPVTLENIQIALMFLGCCIVLCITDFLIEILWHKVTNTQVVLFK